MALRPLPLVPGFTTSRLQLRGFTPEDREELDALLAVSREHLERWVTMPASGEVAAWLTAAQGLHRRGVRASYGLRLADNTLIGGAQLEILDRGRVAIGYWLAPDHTGNGYATEAAGALVRMAFANLGAQRVEIVCDPENRASQRVAARLGFARESAGLWLVDGAAQAWRELEQRLAADREIVARRPGTFTIGSTPGRAAVRLNRLELQGRPWVELIALVAPAGSADPADMLRHNATLALGALCIAGDDFVLRHAAPAEALGGDAADLAVELLGHEAARLRRMLVKTRDPAVFEVFAE